MAFLLEDAHWLFSLFSHWIEWAALFSLVYIVFTPFLTKLKVPSVILSVAIILIFLFKSYNLKTFENKKNVIQIENQKNYYFLFANLNASNSSKTRFIELIQKESPDLLLLVEVNSSWVERLKDLNEIYPYSKIISREGNFGMAVLSKTAIINEKIFVDRENMIPALMLTVKSHIGDFKLALLHAFPPIGSYGTLVRNQYLGTLSREIGELPSPIVVCGDLNTTPWSSIYKDFLRQAKLSPSQFGLFNNTWPAIKLIPGIPIDHCFVRGLAIVNFEIGPNIGSDHLPLKVHISNYENSL